MIANKEELIPELAQKYKDGAKLKDLAREYGIAASTIGNWLWANGLELRHSGRRLVLDRDKLQEFADKGMTTAEMADYFHCSQHTVCQRMSEYKIKINVPARFEKKPVKETQVQAKPKKKKCGSCVFRAHKSAVNGCNYSSIIERCRLQKPEECTFYERGRRIDPNSARARKKKAEVWARLYGGTA